MDVNHKINEMSRMCHDVKIEYAYLLICPSEKNDVKCRLVCRTRVLRCGVKDDVTLQR